MEFNEGYRMQGGSVRCMANSGTVMSLEGRAGHTEGKTRFGFESCTFHT